MSVLLTAYPPAAPGALTDVYGNRYEYIEQTADEAVNAYDESEDDR